MTEPDLTGRLLGGRYRIGRLLGQGGMGVVYEAFQEDLGRKVAVKVLRAGELPPEVAREALDRFQREARAAAALGSPHIVQVFDFQALPGEPAFLVMELLAGETLSDAVKRQGQLPPTRVARIGVHVLSALAAAHQQGILHRDIKPGNVFLTASPTLGEIAKVLDFGIAKFSSGRQLTQAGMVFGTAAYMSPEHATGGELDGRADVYSTAVTLYRALTGRSPFAGASPEDLLRLIVSGGGASLTGLRPDLEPTFAAIISQGMAPDRSQRFPSADAMAQALDAWLRVASSAERPLAFGQSAPQAPSASGPVSQAHSMIHATGPQAPTASLGPRLPAAKARSLWLPMLVGVGVLLVAVIALGGGGLYALQAGLFDPDPKLPDFGDAGAAPRAAASASQPQPTSSGASPARDAEKRRTGVGPVEPSKSPSVDPTSVQPTAPAETSGDKHFGSPCTPESGCGQDMECVGGRCECFSGRTRCGQTCAPLATDPNHCGNCSNVCGSQEICAQGSCVACTSFPAHVMCGNRCVALMSDFSNCGACFAKCPLGKLCIQGQCAK